MCFIGYAVNQFLFYFAAIGPENPDKMEDDNSLSERILSLLETILHNDPELKEFSVVPADSNTKNKSPVLYQEHNIGLESWCIKHIYRYAYVELFEIRQLLKKKKLSFSKGNTVNRLLIGVLLVHPDVSTFWNMKRELVEQDFISVTKELLFTKMVLSYKSKSNEAFAYRRWLLKRILTKLQENDTQSVQTLLQNELAVCEMTAERNSNNYHAWTHRIWCVEMMGNRVTNFSDVILQELEFSQKWLSEHVSEHTGYHYRQYLFKTVRKSKYITSVYESYYHQVLKILNLVHESDPTDILTFLLGKEKLNSTFLEEKNSVVNFLCLLFVDLYVTVEMLNSVFPNHEALWCHRRYLLYHLIKTAYEYHGLVFKLNGNLEDVTLHGTNIVNVDLELSDGEKQPKLFKSQPNKVESSLLYQSLTKSESEFIKKNLTHSGAFYELQLAKRYEKWLKSVICLDNV